MEALGGQRARVPRQLLPPGHAAAHADRAGRSFQQGLAPMERTKLLRLRAALTHRGAGWGRGGGGGHALHAQHVQLEHALLVELLPLTASGIGRWNDNCRTD